MAAKRLVFVYGLNILAAFAVVMLHVSLDVFAPQGGGDPSWFTSFWLQAAFIFAVPVFFAVSGMNLLDYRARYDTRTFFAKRVRRVGVVLLFGSAVCYLAYGLFPHAFGMGEAEGSVSVLGFARGVFSDSINDTYWFFYTIIALYILTPVLSLAVGDKHLLQYIMVCTFVASVLVPLIVKLGVDRSYLVPLFGWAAFANVALLYYVGGFYLARYVNRPEGFPVPWWASALLYLVSTAAMAVASATSNGFMGFAAVPSSYDPYWISITSPLCVVQAASVFMAAMALEPRLAAVGKRGRRFLAQVSGASLGVYLIQMPVINWLGWRLPFPRYQWLQPVMVRGVAVFAAALVLSLAWGCVRGAMNHLISRSCLGGANSEGKK